MPSRNAQPWPTGQWSRDRKQANPNDAAAIENLLMRSSALIFQSRSSTCADYLAKFEELIFVYEHRDRDDGVPRMPSRMGNQLVRLHPETHLPS